MSIDDMEDEQVDDQLMFFKQEREKEKGGSLTTAKVEEEEAEAALDAPDRRARVQTSMQSDDRDANSDISDENIPPVPATKRGRGRGRGSTMGQPRGRGNAARGKGNAREKNIIPESDEEEEDHSRRRQMPKAAVKNTKPPPTGRGRYAPVAGTVGKAQPLTQTSIVSAFSRQSQNISNNSETNVRTVGKNKSILYDSDSD